MEHQRARFIIAVLGGGGVDNEMKNLMITKKLTKIMNEKKRRKMTRKMIVLVLITGNKVVMMTYKTVKVIKY